MAAPSAVVTVHVWRVRSPLAALAAVARDRPALRRMPGLRFAKLLGTSRDFTARGADPHRWVLVGGWASRAAADDFAGEPLTARWQARAVESWHGVLQPTASRGQWSGREPFAVAPAESLAVAAPDGPVAALTRARIAPRRLVEFWRAARAVGREAVADRAGNGMLAGFGIGEAPVGYQGTFTIWSSEVARAAFVQAPIAHRSAVERTRTAGWYAEELFARFAIVSSYGTIDGCDPLNPSR